MWIIKPKILTLNANEPKFLEDSLKLDKIKKIYALIFNARDAADNLIIGDVDEITLYRWAYRRFFELLLPGLDIRGVDNDRFQAILNNPFKDANDKGNDKLRGAVNRLVDSRGLIDDPDTLRGNPQLVEQWFRHAVASNDIDYTRPAFQRKVEEPDFDLGSHVADIAKADFIDELGGEKYIDEFISRYVTSQEAKSIVMLADNNQEVIFLLKLCEVFLSVNPNLKIYFVAKKDNLCMNDASVDDVKRTLRKPEDGNDIFVGLREYQESERFVVVENGLLPAQGIPIDMVSSELADVILKSDAVYSAGEANFYTLNGTLQALGRENIDVYFGLKVKWTPFMEWATAIPRKKYEKPPAFFRVDISRTKNGRYFGPVSTCGNTSFDGGETTIRGTYPNVRNVLAAAAAGTVAASTGEAAKANVAGDEKQAIDELCQEVRALIGPYRQKIESANEEYQKGNFDKAANILGTAEDCFQWKNEILVIFEKKLGIKYGREGLDWQNFFGQHIIGNLINGIRDIVSSYIVSVVYEPPGKSVLYNCLCYLDEIELELQAIQVAADKGLLDEIFNIVDGYVKETGSDYRVYGAFVYYGYIEPVESAGSAGKSFVAPIGAVEARVDGGAAAVAGAASTGISFSALKAALVGYCYRFRTNTYNGQYVQTVEVIDGQKSKFFNLPVPAVHAEVAPGYQQILSSFFEGLFQRLFGEELERVTFTWKENKNAIVVTVIRSAAVAAGTVAAGTGEAATNGADAAPVAGFTVLGVTDNIESTGRKMQELTQSVAEENNLGKVNVQLFNILAVPAAENIITAITDKAEEIRAERVFLWLDNDTADIAGAIKYLRETGNLEIEVVVLSGNDDAAARKAIKESL